MSFIESAYDRIREAAGGEIPEKIDPFVRRCARSAEWAVVDLCTLLRAARARERAAVLRELATPVWAGGVATWDQSVAP